MEDQQQTWCESLPSFQGKILVVSGWCEMLKWRPTCDAINGLFDSKKLLWIVSFQTHKLFSIFIKIVFNEHSDFVS